MTRHQTLPPALEGDLRETNRRAGRLAYQVAGNGPPMLLIHSINAAASAYEVLPIFDRMKSSHRVYVVELPGYGHSDRSDRSYDIRLFTNAILDMLDVIAEDAGPGTPVDALALSLSAEFVARAAVERPERFRTLTLVTPTGFSKGSTKAHGGIRTKASREVPGVYRAISFPLWGRGLYDLLVSRRSIRYFLERTWGSKNIDDGMVDYDYLTSHQPGARHAPFAFLSGRLFSRDIRDLYERLTLPVWMPHGTRGDFKDFSGVDFIENRPNWRRQAFDAGALVHFEWPDDFAASYRAFLTEMARQEVAV
ncbi:alpha/beta fold hydrolase [Skermanella stibiiresistens]|uniref:alpha/beta fold hydrolase n=1 Tax=Skermanella stibiiresistens TaxID=913326 RepID=UPI0004B6C51E|nr:alpha/beta hydrolase [Skermanella stibiiresistens]